MVKHCILLLNLIIEQNGTIYWLRLLKPGYHFDAIRLCKIEISMVVLFNLARVFIKLFL